MGFIYTAQTGLNYRRYKKGEIDKKEFWHRMKLNSVTTVGSLAVGSGGAAAGFALGTAIFPGIGSIVGAVVGGIAGGFAGEKWSAKAYKSIEQRIKESKLKKK
jgi:outer membrane lipoprotein SlyB